MSALRVAWDRFWFTPSSPYGLGLVRVLLFAGFLVLYAPPGKFVPYASVSHVFYQPPTFPLPVAPEATLRFLHRLWRVVLALAALGLLTRVTMAASFVLGAYLLALSGSFGRVHHNDVAVVLVLAILALSRAGDALSIDALRRRARAAPSGEHRWPLLAIQLVLATAYFAAGVSKLRHSGLDWIFTDNLRFQILERNSGLLPSSDLGLCLARQPLLCRALAGFTVALEILFPLALVHRLARAVLVPASLLMLLGVALFLGPRFTTFALLSLAFVPWDPLLARLSRSARAPAPAP